MKRNMKRIFFTSIRLHDNFVIDKILRRQEDGLCEKASALSTVFQPISDVDMGLIFSHKDHAPACFFDENLAKLSEILYRNVTNRFPLDLELTCSIILWETNAKIVNETENKNRAIRRLSYVYQHLDENVVKRFIKNYENLENDTAKLVMDIISKEYEVYNQRL